MRAGGAAVTGHVVVHHDSPMADSPIALAAFEPVDVASTPNLNAIVCQHVCGQYVRLDVGDVAIELDRDVGQPMLAGLEVFRHKALRLGHKGWCISHPATMVIDRIKVVDRSEEFYIESVDRPAVTNEDLGDCLTIGQVTDETSRLFVPAAHAEGRVLPNRMTSRFPVAQFMTTRIPLMRHPSGVRTRSMWYCAPTVHIGSPVRFCFK